MKPGLVVTAITAFAVMATAAQVPGPGPQDEAAALTARSSAYVSRFIAQFSNVVASEEYAQSQTRAQAFGSAVLRRQSLTSNVYFVRASEAENWVVFREVLARDGRPIPPRPERVIELLLAPGTSAREIADRVAAESARYSLPTGRRSTT